MLLHQCSYVTTILLCVVIFQFIYLIISYFNLMSFSIIVINGNRSSGVEMQMSPYFYVMKYISQHVPNITRLSVVYSHVQSFPFLAFKVK